MRQFNLSEDSVTKLYRRYLLPSICATMITSLYIIADTVMIGHGIGSDALVALNLLLPMFSFMFGIGNMLGIGGGVLASVAMGSGNDKRSTEIFSTAITAAVIIAIIFTIGFSALLRPMCYLLGAKENTIGYAMEYGRILFMCCGALILSSCIQGFVRNDKDPNRAMAAVLSGSGLNIIIDYILIYPMDMGMTGAIAATIAGAVVNVIIASTHFMSPVNNLHYSLKSVSFGALADICKSGATSLLVELSSGITTFVFNIQIIRYLGNDGVVVYSVLANSILVCLSMFNGASQAAQPIAAHNYGAGRYKRVGEVRRIGMRVVIVLAIILMIYVNLLPDTLIDAFVKADNNIYSMGRKAIHIYFMCLIPTAINIYLSNFLQATVKAAQAFIITFARGVFLNVLLVIALPLIFGGGVIWYVVPVTEMLTLIIALTLAKSNDTIFTL